MFEHVVLLEALVSEFGPEGWSEELDFEKAHQLQGKFGLPDFEQRESDMLWSVPRKDGSTGAYVVLMLEFQSSNDRWMAVRLLMYAALMWQRTIHEASLGARDKLPPVLGLVTYRGEGRWTAPQSLSELIDLPPEHALRAWQPQMR
jgi:predicted transposase YdaD